MLQSDLEVIAEYGNHPEAELAGQLLESNGIQSITHSDDCGGPDIYPRSPASCTRDRI